MSASPFKFLDSFTKEDKDIFFGRDREIEELYARVFESKLLLVYGISGTGKSSLINCGLSNMIQDSDWLPLNIRRVNDINGSILKIVKSAAITTVADDKPLLAHLESLYLDYFKPPYLIFDQLEELFIFGSADEKKRFIESIKAVIESTLQCRIIFVIREEYLADITDFSWDIPTIFNNRMRIKKMSRTNAEQSITGPCKVYGIEVEEGFPKSLLDKLSPENEEVELTYLQVILDKVYRTAQEMAQGMRLKFGKTILDGLGDVSDILGSFLDAQISALENPDTGLVILKSFVSAKGTKRQATEQEINEYCLVLGRQVPRDELREHIQKFVNIRILRDKDENERFELRHDSLAAKIFEKITLVEKELLEVKQFLEHAFDSYRKRGALLSAADISYIAPYEGRLYLNEQLEKFLATSKYELQKNKLRRRNISITSAAVLIFLLSGLTVWALIERGKAKEQQLVAEQKKQEAEQKHKEADEARQAAVENERKAIDARKRMADAIQQASTAESEKEKTAIFAALQQDIAQQKEEEAAMQSRIAEQQTLAAQTHKAQADSAGEKADRLKLLNLAQSLAAQSLKEFNDAQINALLALQAHAFNSRNSGNPQDPRIYDALRHANEKIAADKSVKLSSEELSSFYVGNNLSKGLNTDGELLTLNINTENIAVSNTKLKSIVPINSSYFIDNGKLLVTGYEDNTARLWDIADNAPKLLKELNGHAGLVRAVAYNAKKKMLVTGGRDGNIMIWNINDVKEQPSATFTIPSRIRSLILDEDGTSIVSGSEDGGLYRWDILTGNKKLLTQSAAKILSLGHEPSGNVVFAGYSDGTVKKVKPNGNIEQFSLSDVGIELICLYQKGNLIAFTSADKTIQIYPLSNLTDKPVVIKDHGCKIHSIMFSEDGKLFALCSDNRIRSWETRADRLASELCSSVKRNLTQQEWAAMVGEDIPYEKACR